MHPLSDSITGHTSQYKTIFYSVLQGIIQWGCTVALPHLTKAVHLRVWQHVGLIWCPGLLWAGKGNREPLHEWLGTNEDQSSTPPLHQEPCKGTASTDRVLERDSDFLQWPQEGSVWVFLTLCTRELWWYWYKLENANKQQRKRKITF